MLREAQNNDFYRDWKTTLAYLADHKWSAEQTLGITALYIIKMVCWISVWDWCIYSLYIPILTHRRLQTFHRFRYISFFLSFLKEKNANNANFDKTKTVKKWQQHWNSFVKDRIKIKWYLAAIEKKSFLARKKKNKDRGTKFNDCLIDPYF